MKRVWWKSGSVETATMRYNIPQFQNPCQTPSTYYTFVIWSSYIDYSEKSHYFFPSIVYLQCTYFNVLFKNFIPLQVHNIHLHYIPFFHARGISVLNKETNCNWCHKNMLKIETKVIYLIFLGGDSVSAFWSCLLDCTSLRNKILIISKDWWNIY